MMFIKNVVLHNFKSYTMVSDNDIKIDFTAGVNYLVGNNNVGKTTVFNALDFLISGGKKQDVISKGHETEDVSVMVTLEDVSESEDSLKKYNSYIDNGELIIKRSSQENSVLQGEKGKEKNVKLDIKKVRVFNPKKEQFENPTGADSTIRHLIDPQIIYADMHNEDYQDFGTTKTTGKLIHLVTKKFQEGQAFSELKAAHEKAFGDEGIKKDLVGTEKKVNDILENQFGESQMRFEFDFPDVNALLKKGTILSTENDMETDIGDKGNGLQRALALAIIQVYSELSNKNEHMQYLIDEPEIYLHPIAQDKLIDSLVHLADRKNQVFITTHSPYILRHYREHCDSINILSLDKETGQRDINTVDRLLFSPTSIGEVTYKAFGVPTIDFHQLLFTKLYLNWVENEQECKHTLLNFDKKFLVNECKTQNLELQKFYPRYNGGKFGDEDDRTLPYIVRNEIDHPEILENGKNKWTEDNLRRSIDCLLKIYKKQNR